MDPRRAAAVEAAASQIGPGDVPMYWRSCRVPGPPYPPFWCGAFALWALHEAGITDVPWVIGRGFCEVNGLRRTRSPLPGDIAYTDKPWQHHALVESLSADGILTTIDGNQPAVKRKVRQIPRTGIVFYSVDRFLKQDKPDTDPAPPPPPFSPPGLTRGIDVSHHQQPGLVRWAALALTHRFSIARATYGSRPDTTFAAHTAATRSAGMVAGAYHFFRPGQGVDEQLGAFNRALEEGGCEPGWIVPAVDIEQNVANDGPVSPERYRHSEELVRRLRERWGGALVYTNPAMWTQLGNPEWIRDFPIWIAHYNAAEPRVPFHLPWALWQHRVAPLQGLTLDQNYARVLPVIHEEHTRLALKLLPLTLDWEALRRDRDEWLREN